MPRGGLRRAAALEVDVGEARDRVRRRPRRERRPREHGEPVEEQGGDFEGEGVEVLEVRIGPPEMRAC